MVHFIINKKLVSVPKVSTVCATAEAEGSPELLSL